jgi:hypothetical protein
MLWCTRPIAGGFDSVHFLTFPTFGHETRSILSDWQALRLPNGLFQTVLVPKLQRPPHLQGQVPPLRHLVMYMYSQYQ